METAVAIIALGCAIKFFADAYRFGADSTASVFTRGVLLGAVAVYVLQVIGGFIWRLI